MNRPTSPRCYNPTFTRSLRVSHSPTDISSRVYLCKRSVNRGAKLIDKLALSAFLRRPTTTTTAQNGQPSQTHPLVRHILQHWTELLPADAGPIGQEGVWKVSAH